MIKFKHERLFIEATVWPLMHTDLAYVLYQAGKYVDKHFHADLVLTSLYRDSAEQREVNPTMPTGSTHQTVPCRGADIRNFIYTPPQRSELADWLNSRYEYDPARKHLKVAVLEADHIHLQVHPNTIMRPVASDPED